MTTEFSKNTRFIITILFSLIAMAVQAQVKSGLDLCLRDETTGEWLIGVKDLNIVYLYLANRSNEEQWKTAIAQFHLTSENCTHYNLPDKKH